MTSHLPTGDLPSRLLASAELEQPPSELGSRVIAEISQRQRVQALATPLARQRIWFWPGLGMGALMGAAACLALLLGPRTVSVRPEPSGSVPAGAVSGSPAVAAAPSGKPLVDPCQTGVRASGGFPLIDDFEDGDDAIFPIEGRSAFWRWNRDIDRPGTAPALLPMLRPDATKSNRQALHIKGGRLRDWGASIEMKLESLCYDASAYAGLAFVARGPGRMYVAPREVGVIERAFGGTCDRDCYNAHVKKIELGSSWQTYEVRWAEAQQRGYNRPPLDPKRLHDIAFLVEPEDTPYDLWIDDLRFLPK
jgi:hypothetical protein